MPALPLEVVIAVGLLALVAGVLWRRRRLVTIQSELDARLPRSGSGIIVGAETITLEVPRAPAVLLLHGGGDTPQSLHYLAGALHARGYAVLVPLLPGHGRSLREFGAATADDWAATARTSFFGLRASHPWVGLVGLSMGGALAVRLAAEIPDVPALALIAPYLTMPRGDALAARFAPLWQWILPVARTATAGSILDPEERKTNLAYGVFVPAALHALWVAQRRGAAAIGAVRAPTLMVQSREDNRISVHSGEQSFARLGAAEKRMEWVEGAGHVITVDHGRQHVARLVVDWMDAHGGALRRQ